MGRLDIEALDDYVSMWPGLGRNLKPTLIYYGDAQANIDIKFTATTRERTYNQK
jgi:hypothetical protein